MTDKSIKLMLWGCGHIAQAFHLPILSSMDALEIVAVADMRPVNLSSAQQIVPDARAFNDYIETLTIDADGVVICLPPHLHARAAMTAFDAGLACYIEKPLAVDMEQATQVLEHWKQSGVVGMVGFNYRFHPRFLELRERLPEIGKVIAVQSVFSNIFQEADGWRNDADKGGGVLLDLATHHIDLARFLLDTEIQKVTAFTASHYAEQDTAVLNCLLEDDVMMQSLVTVTSTPQHRYDIYGQNGQLSVNLFDPLYLSKQEATWQGARTKRIFERIRALSPRRLLLSPGFEPSFEPALAAFVESVRRGQLLENCASVQDGYRSCEVIFSI